MGAVEDLFLRHSHLPLRPFEGGLNSNVGNVICAALDGAPRCDFAGGIHAIALRLPKSRGRTGGWAESALTMVKRANFLAGAAAALSAATPLLAHASTPGGTGVSPQQLLERLMAGNKRFVNNEAPTISDVAEKREMLTSSQAPFAAILGCADSRVIPNLVFAQGLGDLFVARVAGNYPDDDAIASFEYAIEHLGTTLLMILGHQSCGAITAVYEAIKTNTPLPPHLSSLEREIAPGILGVVQRRGTVDAAVEANVRAGVARLKASPPVIAERVKSGRVLVVGGFYHLGNGQVSLIQ